MAQASVKPATTARRDPALDRLFGNVLRRMRVQQGMTQEQLAWQTGIERAFISELERGVKGASVTMLFRLAAGLGVQAGTIIAEVEQQLIQASSR